jgi:hypothetical protein
MPTTPVLPLDEAPLDEGTVDLFLTNMGTDMVLVGGQALAFWMSRFGIARNDVAVSNDGDALGQVSRAITLAHAMRARIELPEKTSRTAIVAQLRLTAPDNKERNIDVLHKLYTVAGLKKSSTFTKRVIEDSVTVEWKPGHLIRVMDPFDVLESRAQNAVGLFDDKGPHVVTQAAWAIQVAREALRRISVDPAPGDRLGRKIQRIYTLARSNVGKRLLAEHGLELLDAIDIATLEVVSPAHEKQFVAVLKARQARQPAQGC